MDSFQLTLLLFGLGVFFAIVYLGQILITAAIALCKRQPVKPAIQHLLDEW